MCWRFPIKARVLQKKIDQTQTELEGATARVTALQNKTGLNSRQAMGLNSISQSSPVQPVLEEYQQLEDQLAAERTRFREENPKIVNLQLELAAKKALLQERVAQVLGSGQQLPGKNLQIGELQQKLISDLVNAEVERSNLT